MALAEPVQPVADRGAVDRHALFLLQFQPQLVQRQVAFLGQPGPHPASQLAQLAASTPVALRLGIKPAGLAPQLDHVVHKLRRCPEMPRRFAMAIPLINKRNNALTQLKWMWLAHSCPLYLLSSRGNHKKDAMGILNLVGPDML